MAKITKEDVIKIARISYIELQEHEIEPLARQLESVLSYAERVGDLAGRVDEQSNKAVNVFREDIVIPTDADTVLAQAPEADEHYFVVPRILESNQ